MTSDRLLAFIVAWALGGNTTNAAKLSVMLRDAGIDSASVYQEAVSGAVSARQTSRRRVRRQDVNILDIEEETATEILEVAASSMADDSVSLDDLDVRLAAAWVHLTGGDPDGQAGALWSDVLHRVRLSLLRELTEEKKSGLILFRLLDIDDARSGLDELSATLQRETRRLTESQERTRDDILAAIERGSSPAASVDRWDRERALSQMVRALSSLGYAYEESVGTHLLGVVRSTGLLGQRIAVGLSPTSRPTTVQDLVEYKVETDQLSVDGLLYVLANRIDPIASKFAKESRIRLSSLEALVDDVAGVGPYMERLIGDYESRKDRAVRLYRPPRIAARSDAASKAGGFLTLPLMDTFSRLILLGDYGMGKTTVCERLCYEAAVAYEATCQIPVLLHLDRYNRLDDLVPAICGECRRFGLELSAQIVRDLLKDGRFTLFLDGVDDLFQFSPAREVRSFIDTVDSLTRSTGNKVLMTCRRHFFRESVQEYQPSGWSIAYLERWESGEIGGYLDESTVTERNRALLERSGSLYELCSTPFFLSHLVGLDINQLDSDADVGGVLQSIVDDWIRREGMRSRLSPEQKRAFLVALARYLLLRGEFSVHYTDMRSIVSSMFRTEFVEELDYFEADVRTATFLKRDPDGNYRFSHRPFLEYFSAICIADELRQLASWLDGDDVQAPTECVVKLRKLSRETWSFAAAHVDSRGLTRLVEATSDRSQAWGFLSANCLGILRSLNGDVRDIKFANTQLPDSEFRGLDLRGMSFSGANLFTANLNDCQLDEVDMRRADLTRCSIKASTGVRDALVLSSGRIVVAKAGITPLVVLDEDPSGEAMGELEGHWDDVWCLSTGWAEEIVLSGGRDNRLVAHDVSTLRVVRTFEGHADNVWGVSWSPESGHFASCSSDRLVKVWSPRMSSPVARLGLHGDEVRSVAWMSGTEVLSCSVDGVIVSWNWRANRWKVWESRTPKYALAVAPVAGLAIIGAADGELTAVQGGLGGVAWQQRLGDADIRVVTVDEPKGEVFTGESDGTVRACSLFDGTPTRVVHVHPGSVNCVRVVADSVLSGAYDDDLVVTGGDFKHVLRLPGTATGGRFSCEGLRIDRTCGLSPERLRYLEMHGAVIEG